MRSLADKVALVTGAGRGIGLEFARQLKARGDQVIATARDPEAASDLRGLGVRVEALNVAAGDSVRALAERLAGVPIDVLVNNAGLGGDASPLAELDFVRLTRFFEVNSIGPLRVAQALLPNLRAAGSTVVAIVNEPESVLAREADECVIVRSRPDEAVAVQSYTGTAFVALLLASLVADEDRWSEAEQCIGAVRRALDECARRPCLLPAGCRVVYALGRGPSVASALEGALLFHETAKLPCVGMPAGNFRHGPFEAVDGSFHSFVIASSPETRKLDEALRDQIRGFGGTAEWISVEPGHFAPVAEVIPLQFAAYHAALARGFVPGKFRYVTLVTTSETEFGASGGRS